MTLKEGMRVEARFNQEGYRGAWVEGIVISFKRGTCTIKLNKFATGNGNSSADETPLITVSPAHVRPIPPRRQLPLHSLEGVAVEAKETDCWWPGFIVREISCDGRKLLLVSFPHTNILTAYPLPLLRPAQNWRGGKWMLVRQKKKLNIGQVIRVQETPKSSNDRELCQGCPPKKTIDEPSSTGYESKTTPVSTDPQMSSGQLKRIRLEEQNQEENQQGKEKKLKMQDK